MGSNAVMMGVVPARPRNFGDFPGTGLVGSRIVRDEDGPSEWAEQVDYVTDYRDRTLRTHR